MPDDIAKEAEELLLGTERNKCDIGGYPNQHTVTMVIFSKKPKHMMEELEKLRLGLSGDDRSRVYCQAFEREDGQSVFIWNALDQYDYSANLTKMFFDNVVS